MNTVVAGIEKPMKAQRIRELFDMLLANFDMDGDGRLSLFEFSESMKTLKWWIQEIQGISKLMQFIPDP